MRERQYEGEKIRGGGIRGRENMREIERGNMKEE